MTTSYPPHQGTQQTIWQRLKDFIYRHFIKTRAERRQLETVEMGLITNEAAINSVNNELEVLTSQEQALRDLLPSLNKKSPRWNKTLQDLDVIRHKKKNKSEVIASCYQNIKTLNAQRNALIATEAMKAITITKDDVINIKTRENEARDEREEIVMTNEICEEAIEKSRIAEQENERLEHLAAEIMQETAQPESPQPHPAVCPSEFTLKEFDTAVLN